MKRNLWCKVIAERVTNFLDIGYTYTQFEAAGCLLFMFKSFCIPTLICMDYTGRVGNKCVEGRLGQSECNI